MSLQKETFYCVKCRVKKDYTPERMVLMDSNRHSLVTKCPVCNYNMFKFVGMDKLKTKYTDLTVEKYVKKKS